MPRLRALAALALTLALFSPAAADVVYYGAAGQTLYARINRTGDTAFDLTEGSSLKSGQYTATNATIAGTSLPAGTYTYRVFIGTASGQSSSDIDVGAGSMIWNGTGTVAENTAQLDLSQAVPASNAANTIGDCLNAARAQAVGKTTLNAATRELKVYSYDGTTVIGTMLIGPNLSAPLTRTPQ